MRTYQTLSLIGCIFGILLTIGLTLLLGGVKSVGDTLLNMSRPTESERQEHVTTYAWISPAIGGLFFAFLIYIAILVVTFAVRTKTKAVGITIIILGIIGMATTNLWGIIPFALLLPAGISALRYKRELTKPTSD
jgi:glucan phosphoethanolaminetransferase (alkaline phosphatase superfamily)